MNEPIRQTGFVSRLWNGLDVSGKLLLVLVIILVVLILFVVSNGEWNPSSLCNSTYMGDC